MSKIKVGDYVKDTITGYEGVAVGITTWLNGCARIGIQSKDGINEKTGLPSDLYWVDDATVEVVKKQLHKTVQNTTGASNFSSGRNSDPSFH